MKKTEANISFSLKKLTKKDWADVAGSIVVESGKFSKGAKINDVNVLIANDNTAILMFNCEGERKVTINKYGIKEADYVGYASDCFRGIMSGYFGKAYEDALVAKFGDRVEPSAE